MSSHSETARLNALLQLSLLDTSPSESFDRITRLASQLFDLPIAAVSLTDHDRQWFKSRVGVEHWQIPRERAPCADVATTTQLLVVPDLLEHPYFKDSPLADSGVRFYAGAPLVTRDGHGLGAMCVLGMEPREATASELATLSDMAAMVMAQIELQHAFGRIDPLSGMPNRNQFIEDLHDLTRDREPGERRLAVLVDLATTDQVNTAVRALGPAYLDEIVRNASQFFRTTLRAEIKTYHVAGTQFAFLAPPGVAEAAYAAEVAERLGRLEGETSSRFISTYSVGIAPFALGVTTPEDVLRTAHGAAQDASSQETRVSVYSASQDEAHARRFRLLQDLPAAIDGADQLRLAYQPRIDLTSGRCVGAEALLRWRHPTLGEISPAEFIPLVEQTTMARALTAWVIEEALSQLALWRTAGLDLQVSVNISASNLQESDFLARLEAGLARHRLGVEHIELEITESAVMQDHGLGQLRRLADAGVRLAIDDFGTGYSNFSYLQMLPIRVVKIDQSFVREMAADKVRAALVAMMVNLSHELGYRVVAEGIESEAVAEALGDIGCDEAQGYHFGRPMPAADFPVWLHAFSHGGRRLAKAG